ncbi:hypothetical protein [Corynebacterium oculi]|uniref:Uncharacterized protein n=1 Tax=Corynebacterium oculi TaxID=1544416 RepID=A0A0Q0YET1_9CORY|nr:hypothetical protein [Corynebacterium oculi]KQB84908.1 hypothetical protein Cocul_00037 [Corynebacterium oculi]
MSLTDFIMGYDERQARRWHAKQERRGTPLPAWRTPQRQRLLIGTYFGALSVSFIAAIGVFFSLPFIWLWIFTTLISFGSWCILRETIDHKDFAPAAVLDEYENQVLNTWRSLAFGLCTSILPLLACALGVLSVLDSANLSRWLFSLALLTASTGFLIGMLPAVGYSLAFHTSDPKE